MGLPSQNLTNILAKNGMYAGLDEDRDGRRFLILHTENSPVHRYELTGDQWRKLLVQDRDTATGAAIERAYNLIATLARNEFSFPNYNSAQQAHSLVNMGQRGKVMSERLYHPMYGSPYPPRPRGYATPYFHAEMRFGRPFAFPPLFHHHHHHEPSVVMGERSFMAHEPRPYRPAYGFARPFAAYSPYSGGGGYAVRQYMIEERPDRHLKPGEMRTNYGIQPIHTAQAGLSDPLTEGGNLRRYNPGDDHTAAPSLKPYQPEALPRSTEPAIALGKAHEGQWSIDNAAYFTTDKWKSVLDSHGFVVDQQSNTITVQSSATPHDIIINIPEEQMNKLMSNDLSTVSIKDRLDIINSYISPSFSTALTYEELNSTKRYSSELTPEAQQALKEVEEIVQEEVAVQHPAVSQLPPKAENVITLATERDGYFWHQDGQNGRDVILNNAAAFQMDGKYYVQANINGEQVQKEITAKDYREIYYRTDSRRIELLDEHLDGIEFTRGRYKGEDVLTNQTYGQDLAVIKPSKGWYRPGSEGREVSVESITASKNPETGKYQMTAVIDGKEVTHEISAKQYEKFMNLNDLGRMKLADKVFDEIKMKANLPFGMRVEAALTAFVMEAPCILETAAFTANTARGMVNGHDLAAHYFEEAQHSGPIMGPSHHI